MTDMEVAGAREAITTDFDVVVIGAGFSGLYMLYKLRELGFRANAIEAGEGVGGTWFWNRYPGARCDVQSIEYSFSFSKEIEQEWDWTELMPAQPEIEAYLNFVADRLDLRRDIQFSTKATALTYDEPSATWTVKTDRGDRWTSRFVVAATGCLSAPLEPDIEGLQAFEGASLFTSRFPSEGFDFVGKRVGVIGTGSSGVQVVPEIARVTEHLFVFQRSATYSLPSGNRPLGPGELDDLKANYDDLRRRQRAAFAGVLGFGALSYEGVEPPSQMIMETPMEQRLAKLDELGWAAPLAWADVMVDLEANKAATALYGELIKRVVKDPATAQSLVPHYPMGCKRTTLNASYYETFNLPNVTLVDLRKGGIKAVTPAGIDTEQGSFDLDVIVYATGFDAMTGALNRMEIRGRGGQALNDLWTREGPVTYLGLQVAGFPNLFTITGPGSPSVLSNMVVSIEQHVEWIADCLSYLREHEIRTIEADKSEQDRWVLGVASFAEGSFATAESCNSWYLGANIPGKKRVYMPYLGGLPTYRQVCADVAAADYRGFILA